MTVSLTGVVVMLSGPSDTAEDIALAFRTIHEWNDRHAAKQQVVFLPEHYTKNVVPVYSAGADGQMVINEQITDRSDVVMCFFRHRLGTPTPRSAESGSVEEVEIGAANGHAHVWFWNGDIPRGVSDDDRARKESDRLRDFRKSFEVGAPRGLYGVFGSGEELRDEIERVLWEHARRQPVAAQPGQAVVARPSLEVVVQGPVWHLPDLEKVIRESAQTNAASRGLGARAAERYLEACLERSDELDERLAANAAMPLAVEVATDGARIQNLEIEITFPGAFGVDPDRMLWHDVWETPEPAGGLIRSYAEPVAPYLGSMSTWSERSSWDQVDDGVVVTVEIDDLRARRTPTRVDRDVVINLVVGTSAGHEGREGSVPFSWSASGDVGGGKIESWDGEGLLDVIAERVALQRLVDWRRGRLWDGE